MLTTPCSFPATQITKEPSFSKLNENIKVLICLLRLRLLIAILVFVTGVGDAQLIRALVITGATVAAAPVTLGQWVQAPINFQA